MTHSFSLVFPGQGSQSVGMLAELDKTFSQVAATFEEASEVFGQDLWALSQEGPAEKLDQTAYTQPALLAADIAVWRCWQIKTDLLPSVVAGHSLGEYAALVCAGALSFSDAIALVADRGRFMQEAVLPGQGAMAAVIGLDDAKVAELCQIASQTGVVSPANFNSIGQVVIAGETSAVDHAIELAKNAGARMAKTIPVSVPSHCALMKPAADQMAEKLKNVTFHKPMIPVIHNVDVKTYDTPEAIRSALIAQLVQPVRWVETIQAMMAQQIYTYFECGPNRVLSGLNKRISKDICTQGLLNEQEIVLAIQLVSGDN